jgi:hypothetical protein
MKVEIVGDQIIITAQLDKSAPMSSSGKSRILFSSHGFVKPDLKFEGKQVSVGLNVIVALK